MLVYLSTAYTASKDNWLKYLKTYYLNQNVKQKQAKCYLGDQLWLVSRFYNSDDAYDYLYEPDMNKILQ